jgi:hypothetical protein
VPHWGRDIDKAECTKRDRSNMTFQMAGRDSAEAERIS